MRASAQRNDEWGSHASSGGMHTSIASGDYQDPGSEALDLTERSITKTYSHTGLLAHEQSLGSSRYGRDASPAR